MKSKILILCLGLGLLTAASLLIESAPQQKVSHLESKAIQKMNRGPATEAESLNAGNAGLANADKDGDENSNRRSDLHLWLDKNSDHMSSFSESDQKILNQKINELQENEMDELKKISSSTELPANQRVLSLYMLGESRFGEEALKEFLTSELKLKEKAEPHSLDETANGREKALRVMAIQQLIDNASSPQDAHQKLSELIPHLKDPWLKRFAQNKASELAAN